MKYEEIYVTVAGEWKKLTPSRPAAVYGIVLPFLKWDDGSATVSTSDPEQIFTGRNEHWEKQGRGSSRVLRIIVLGSPHRYEYRQGLSGYDFEKYETSRDDVRNRCELSTLSMNITSREVNYSVAIFVVNSWAIVIDLGIYYSIFIYIDNKYWSFEKYNCQKALIINASKVERFETPDSSSVTGLTIQ